MGGADASVTGSVAVFANGPTEAPFSIELSLGGVERERTLGSLPVPWLPPPALWLLPVAAIGLLWLRVIRAPRRVRPARA